MNIYNSICDNIALMSSEEQQLIKQIAYDVCYDTKDYTSLYKFLENVIPAKKLRTIRDVILYETRRHLFQIADDAFMYAFNSEREIDKMIRTFIQHMNSKYFDYKILHTRVLYNTILLMLHYEYMPADLKSKLIQMVDPDYMEYLDDPMILDAYIILKDDIATKELMVQCVFNNSRSQ